MKQQPHLKFDSVIIAGVGLIGGSIASALKARNFEGTVIGFGRNEERLKKCQSGGLIDEYSTDVSVLEKPNSLIIFCTPIDHIVEFFSSSSVIFSNTSIMTDAGSTKESICKAAQQYLPEDVIFIGSHPIAGSEKQGFENARPDLFENRLCVITPPENNDADKKREIALTSLKGFWEFLGSEISVLTPTEHDFHLSQTSHFPHIIASALAGTLSSESAPYASTGFKDTTRISKGDSSVWIPILLDNSESILENMAQFEIVLKEFYKAIENQDSKALKKLLEQAKTKRNLLN
jgi:prephenate dehydrogenase